MKRAQIESFGQTQDQELLQRNSLLMTKGNLKCKDWITVRTMQKKSLHQAAMLYRLGIKHLQHSRFSLEATMKVYLFQVK